MLTKIITKWLKTSRHLKLLFIFLLCTAYEASAHIKPSDSKPYEKYMKQLIELSQKNPRYPFAAMIIDNKTGKVLCEGVNSSTTNPTHHGEMVALNNCVAKYSKLNWANTTLITDAEPCAMCAGAIVWVGISKIVYGTSLSFLLKHGWDQINIKASYVIQKSPFYKGTIVGGVLHKETDKLFMHPH